jgi:hypothetical protein
MKTSRFTLLAALIVASAVPAGLFAVLTPLSGTLDTRSVVGTFWVVYPFSAAATLLFGAPAYLLVSRFNLVRWWSAIAAGGAIGLLVAVLIRLPNSVHVRDLLIMGVAGALSGFSFWLVWRPELARRNRTSG